MISFYRTIGLPQPLANLLFRKSPEGEEIIENHEIADVKDNSRRIRCPLCRWSPDRTSRWTCWDCGHPEYFYGGYVRYAGTMPDVLAPMDLDVVPLLLGLVKTRGLVFRVTTANRAVAVCCKRALLLRLSYSLPISFRVPA